MNLFKTGFINLIIFISVLTATAQTKSITLNKINSVSTAVPFLTIAPDSRSAAMGDVGVATDPDVNSLHWNAAKYAFVKSNECFALSYSPWLRGLVNDMKLLYLTGYKRLDELQVIGASLRYFNLGSVTFTNDQGQDLGIRNPSEFAIDLAYSRKFSDNISSAIAFRYTRSDISAGMSNSVSGAKAGNAFAADISLYYNSEIALFDKNGKWALGANVSNIGNKMSYSTVGQDIFPPINLRLGGSVGLDLDNFNKMSFAVDFNKLLVPTPPYYDSQTHEIVQGKTSDVPVVQGIFQSFTDAPGGFKEELHEVSFGTGLEYRYHDAFAIRTGYSYEHPTKGNRRYFTVGFGFNVSMLEIDFSYLISTYGRNNPLSNTMRFTFIVNLGKQSQKSKV